MHCFTKALSSLLSGLFLVASFMVSPAAVAQVPQAPEMAARAYLLLDVTSNQILAAKDIDSPV